MFIKTNYKNDIPSQEHYYDSVTKRGFIEYRLWTIRKTISPSKKKYTTKKVERVERVLTTKSCELLPIEKLNEKVSSQ